MPFDYGHYLLSVPECAKNFRKWFHSNLQCEKVHFRQTFPILLFQLVIITLSGTLITCDQG